MELCKYRTYEIPASTWYGDEYCMHLCMYFVLCTRHTRVRIRRWPCFVLRSHYSGLCMSSWRGSYTAWHENFSLHALRICQVRTFVWEPAFAGLKILSGFPTISIHAYKHKLCMWHTIAVWPCMVWLENGVYFTVERANTAHPFHKPLYGLWLLMRMRTAEVSEAILHFKAILYSNDLRG